MEVYIYGLVDPKTLRVRYVGKAVNARRRYQAHLYRAKTYRTHVYQWIKSLLKQGIKPDLVILEKTTTSAWQVSEKKWIAYFKTRGNYLTNATSGGDAGTATYGRLGKKNSPEHIEKTRAGRIGKPILRNPESNKRRADGVRRYYARVQRSVYQYALTGEFIKEWKSTVDASIGLFGDKRHSSGILVACKKANSQSGGFLWKFVSASSINPYVKPDVHNKGKTPPLHIREKISKTKKGVKWSVARINAQSKRALTPAQTT